MNRKSFAPGAVLAPIPVVMVSCGTESQHNIITIAWTGIVNSNPPMTYISVRKERYSHRMILERGNFVINLVNEELVRAADWCGVKSGRDIDKFEAMNLHPVPSEKITAPGIAESPFSLECTVDRVIELNSHDMILARIVRMSAAECFVDTTGRIRLDRMKLVAYNHGEYVGLNAHGLGQYGESVIKPSTRKKKNAIWRQKQRMRKKTKKQGR